MHDEIPGSSVAAIENDFHRSRPKSNCERDLIQSTPGSQSAMSAMAAVAFQEIAGFWMMWRTSWIGFSMQRCLKPHTVLNPLNSAGDCGCR